MGCNTLGDLLKLTAHQLNVPIAVEFVCRYDRPEML
jgi:hypothetical protein